MKQHSQSAIQQHYLQAIVPHPVYRMQKQILKTKEFYQPQKFIWNNPHRTSAQMYKFYHAYHKNYCQHKEPLIRRQQEIDRETVQMERIHRLIAFRNKTRDEFAKKKRDREFLEQRSINTPKNTWTSVKNGQNIGVEPSYRPLAESKCDLKNAGAKQVKSERVLRIQNSYKQGLKKYDTKTGQINSLIANQHQDYHKHIRSQFVARKTTNDTANSRFYSKAKKTALQQEKRTTFELPAG